MDCYPSPVAFLLPLVTGKSALNSVPNGCLAEFLWGSAVEFAEGSKKYLIIGKSVFFHQGSDRIVAGEQVFGQVHGADVVQIFEERLPGVFFEQSAKVFSRDGEQGSRRVEGQIFLIMRPDPFHHAGDPQPVAVVVSGDSRAGDCAVVTAQNVQKFI